MTKRDVRALAGRGKVLPFQQSGDFFYKRGLEKLDKNNLPDAIAYYGRALKCDPDNREIRIAMAQVLTEMCRFEESNRILFALTRGGRDEEADPECYFGMGCNFVGLYDYENARNALEHYLALDPDGEFIYDAYDMLDAIDDAEFGAEGDGLFALSKEDRAYDLAEEGRTLLEQDQYEAAVEALQHALTLAPKLAYARNNLALAYFCMRDNKRAAAEAHAVLRDDPKNVQAMCNLAMVYSAMHDDTNANRMADALLRQETDEPEEINRIALVLMELGRFEEAYGVMQRLVRYYPYETGAVHRLAVCAYETGRYQEATECYDKLLKINAGDTVARYYRGLCRAAQTGGMPHGRKREFMFHYQVPVDEMIARVSRLNAILSLPQEEIAARWREDDELLNLVEWGFSMPEEGIKRALLSLVASFHDARAEALLRDYAMRMDQPDRLKQEAFALLAQMGAEGPFVGYIGGRLVESSISFAKGFPADLPKAYGEVITACIGEMYGKWPEKVLIAAVQLWADHVALLGGQYPRLNRHQVMAMAAALAYLACKQCGEKTARADVCMQYGVSALRLNNALSKLTKPKDKA